MNNAPENNNLINLIKLLNYESPEEIQSDPELVEFLNLWDKTIKENKTSYMSEVGLKKSLKIYNLLNKFKVIPDKNFEIEISPYEDYVLFGSNSISIIMGCSCFELNKNDYDLYSEILQYCDYSEISANENTVYVQFIIKNEVVFK